jgi:hypothetical protein
MKIASDMAVVAGFPRKKAKPGPTAQTAMLSYKIA